MNNAQARRSKFNRDSASMIVSSEVNSFISESKKSQEELRILATTINKDYYAIYKPVYDGLRKSSLLQLMFNCFMMIRRLCLVYVAMFYRHQPWLQLIIFTTLSACSLFYLQNVWPMKNRNLNYLNMFNEGVTLVISYLIQAFNGLCNDVGQYEASGDMMTKLLYFCWAVNFLVVLVFFVKDIRI